MQRRLKRQGLSLTEKALQVMTLAAEASSQVDGRRHIAVESVITNLVKANTVATAVFTAVPHSEGFLKTIAHFGSFRDETAWPPEGARGYLDHAIGRAKYQNRNSITCLDLTVASLVAGDAEELQDAMLEVWLSGNSIRLDDVSTAPDYFVHLEPAIEDQQFLLTHDGKEFHFMPYSVLDGLRFVTDASNASHTIVSAKASIIDAGGFFLDEEIDELEWLINQPDVTEQQLHSFFEAHPKFLLGTEYKCLHSKILLESISGGLIPDFFVERIGSNFADIIDLKRPNSKLIVGPKTRRGFSAALTLSLNQLREYRNYFDDSHNRKLFHQRYGFTAFRPRISVLIGMRKSFEDEMMRIAIEDEYKNLRLLTYDDIVERAKQRRSLIKTVMQCGY